MTQLCTGKVVSVLEAGKNLKFEGLFNEQCSRLPIWPKKETLKNISTYLAK